MRTTVTLDLDTENLLREAMRQTGQSFKTTLNQAIRKGLAATDADPGDEPFVVVPTALGLRSGIDPTRLQQLSDELDVDDFLEAAQRVVQRTEGPA